MTETVERVPRPPMTATREAPFALVRDDTGDGEPGDGLTIEGWAILFNTPTVISSWEGRFVEQLAPGSCAQSLRQKTPALQLEHGRHPLVGGLPIGKITSIAEDVDPVWAPSGGVHLIGRLLDSWLISPVREAISVGAIDSMSFRFEVLEEAWSYADGTPIKTDMALLRELEKSWDPSVRDDDLPIRTLLKVLVAEVSPVLFPAYESTSVTVRQGIIDMDRLNDPEQRKLLARACWTLDRDLRGVREIDAASRQVRAMLVQAAARAERQAADSAAGGVPVRGHRDIDIAAAKLAAMRASIAARAARVAALPGVN